MRVCVAEVRVVLNVRKNFAVKVFGQLYVLLTIVSHTTLCITITSLYFLPQVDTFVLKLVRQPKERSNKSKAVHKEPKLTY
tara:strand:- start:34 stop:276 length:243 start_codon:yes stop_codon:yes gene_type:complete